MRVSRQSLLVCTGIILSTLIGDTVSFQQQPIGVVRNTSPNLTTGRRLLDPSIHKKEKRTTTTQLELSPAAPSLTVAASSLLNPLGSISVLAFVVLVHECGHFLAARSLGIAVKEFSVGVGPKLFGFSRSAQDGNIIDFSLRAFPLGGYVQFPENYNSTLLFEMQQDYRLALQQLKEEEDEEDITTTKKKNGWKQGMMQFFNKEYARQLREEEEERIRKAAEEEERKQKAKWWTFSSKNQKSVEKKKEIDLPSVEIEYYDDPNLLQNRPWAERAIVLMGGVVFNILLAFTLYFGELSLGTGIPKPSFQSGAVITQVPRPGGPSVGILNKGDIILGFNGQRMTASDSPTAYEAQESITKFIETIRATEPGDSFHLSVLKYASKTQVEVDVTPKKSMDGPMSIGVTLSPNYQGRTMVKANNVGEAVQMAAVEVSQLTSDTARSILALLGSVISGHGTPAGQSVSGPIGVLKTGTDVVKTNDINAVIGFVAAISVNLAVVNSLPLPALDGGQLAFVLSEALTGKKLDQRKQEAINAAALLFLLAVSFGTAVGDLGFIGRLGR